MNLLLKPWHLLLLVTAAVLQRQNELALELALDELRMYKKRFGRIRLTNEERRVLAVKGKSLDVSGGPLDGGFAAVRRPALNRCISPPRPPCAPTPKKAAFAPLSNFRTDDFSAVRPPSRRAFSGLLAPT